MTMDRTQATAETHQREPKGLTVVSIECLKGSSKADEWTADMLQTGDIVEELKIGSSTTVRSPFKNGKAGVQKLLHNSFKKKETSILVRVRRGSDEFTELQACIVPNELAGKKQYMLRAIGDPNYAVGFFDRTESECLALQASRGSRMVSALTRAQLQDGYVSYRWERKMQELRPVPNSSCFLSILLLPKASDRVASRYNDLEDTLARANTWLVASQASGVPIVFMNIQTESLLTKISGETTSSTVNAGSLSDLSNLANASLYGFEDYHGVDIGVVRAVRLWYAPLGGEFAVEIKLKEGDSKLGFAISRTEEVSYLNSSGLNKPVSGSQKVQGKGKEKFKNAQERIHFNELFIALSEGFIHISSVIDGDENTPSTRSGLSNLYEEAMRASKLLVVSRVSKQKVLPWIVSSTGAVRCFDTVSLSQKLSLHRHSQVPILIHVFMWDRALASPSGGNVRVRAASPPVMPIPPEIQFACQPNENQVLPLPRVALNETEVVLDDRPQLRPERDTADELSFRFHDFSLPNNWV